MGKDITLEFLEKTIEDYWGFNICLYEKDHEFFVYQNSTVCECLTRLREILEEKCFYPETIILDGGHLHYRSAKKCEGNDERVHLFFPRELNDDVDFLVKEIYDDYYKSLCSSFSS